MLKGLAEVMLDSFTKKSEKDQKRYLVAMTEYEAIRKAQAEDETVVPKLTTEVVRGEGKLVCTWCQEPHAKQWLLLHGDADDWQGALTVSC